jgi:hypothetical protein
MPIYFAWFIEALLSVGGDANDQNLPQSGRLLYCVIIPVAVEKLPSEKSAKIKTRQEALQTISFDHLDIFYPRISTCFRKKGVFQQPPLLPTFNS